MSDQPTAHPISVKCGTCAATLREIQPDAQGRRMTVFVEAHTCDPEKIAELQEASKWFRKPTPEEVEQFKRDHPDLIRKLTGEAG